MTEVTVADTTTLTSTCEKVTSNSKPYVCDSLWSTTEVTVADTTTLTPTCVKVADNSGPYVCDS